MNFNFDTVFKIVLAGFFGAVSGVIATLKTPCECEDSENKDTSSGTGSITDSGVGMGSSVGIGSSVSI